MIGKYFFNALKTRRLLFYMLVIFPFSHVYAAKSNLFSDVIKYGSDRLYFVNKYMISKLKIEKKGSIYSYEATPIFLSSAAKNAGFTTNKKSGYGKFQVKTRIFNMITIGATKHCPSREIENKFMVNELTKGTGIVWTFSAEESHCRQPRWDNSTCKFTRCQKYINSGEKTNSYLVVDYENAKKIYSRL